MKIAISTQNENKLKALKEIIEHYTLTSSNIITIDVSSDVPGSPYDDDVIKGATNRVNNLKKIIVADLYVSLETGIIKSYGNLFIVTWCVIHFKDEYFQSASSLVSIPKKIENDIYNRTHEELNNYLDTKSALIDEPTQDFCSYVSCGQTTRYTQFQEALRNTFIAAGFGMTRSIL